MKLIQLNLWSGKLTSPLASFLKEEQPDVLCTQEIVLLEGGDGMVFLTGDEIQEVAGLEHTYYSPLFSFGFLKDQAKFGNGILSRFPITASETIFTYHEFLEDIDYREELVSRNLQHVIVETPDGKQVHVLNHHGYHVAEHKNGNEETLRQCRMIADYIRKIEGPIILTGDFNLKPESESIQQINQLLTNLTGQAGLTTTRTALTHKTEVCDYIFVNDAVKVNKFSASDAVVSDHRALILEFELA